MTKSGLEPGLLRIFRLFIALEAAAFLGVVVSYGSLSNGARQGPEARFLVDLIGCLVLLGYLSWRRLHQALRGAYLPVALTFATLMPIVSSRLWMEVEPGANLPLLILSAWELIPMMFVPLVLTAWQYGRRAVILFCVVPSILDISLALVIAQRLAQPVLSILSVIIIRAASFFVVGYIVAQLVHTQREQRRALLQANVQLSQYANTLEQLAVSRERNRLARELHDTLAHTLSGLAVNLEALKTVLAADPAEAQVLADQSLEITRTGLADTRRALKDLRAAPLEDLGLSLALRHLAQTAAARANVALELDLPDDLGDLPPGVEQNVYRIAQEALENVVRHAEARRLTVGLRLAGNTLRLAIGDDGQGFDPATPAAGERFGLKGMAERAAVFGGRLCLESAPGGGTRVQLDWEIPHA